MDIRRIAVIGAGYVGITTAACLAYLGHCVVCADIDSSRIQKLRRGEVDLFEPGLAELVAAGIDGGRLEFSVGAHSAMCFGQKSPIDLAFLCVPTPMAPTGAADLTAIESVIAEIRYLLPPVCTIVVKSTVPVGTSRRIRELLGREDVSVVSNPEFLRAGSAVRDFLSPDRIVVGSDDEGAAENVAALYAPLRAPIVLTDTASAELVKYAANCFLAMKLSYVNSLAGLCEHFGADISHVIEGIGRDRRIGQHHLRPGPGWGGPCLPKDARALLYAAEAVGFDFPLLRATIETNTRQRDYVTCVIKDCLGGSVAGKRIGLLGLTFKAGTDDLRYSPALDVVVALASGGAELTAYDPAVMKQRAEIAGVLRVVDDPYQAAKGADAVVILTEWEHFREVDFRQLAEAMDGSIIIDTRNHLDPTVVRRAGLERRGIGCGRSANRTTP